MAKAKKGSAGKVFFTIFLILVILLTSGFFLLQHYLSPESIMKDSPAIAGDQQQYGSNRVNILLLGVNQKLSDTIMLGSFDLDTKHVDIISVPRDTYYERSDYSGTAQQKINAVFGSEGVAGSVDAVSDVLGDIPIHYYVVVEDEDIAKIVDSMGGIEYKVPMRMKYTDKKQDLYIDLKKGKQTLNGDQAVQFLRYRKGYAMGDIGRVEAQQSFMKAAFNQALGWQLPKVAKTVIENVETNMNTTMALRLGILGIRLESSDLSSHMTEGTFDRINGLSFWIEDKDATVEMIRDIYSGVPVEEEEE